MPNRADCYNEAHCGKRGEGDDTLAWEDHNDLFSALLQEFGFVEDEKELMELEEQTRDMAEKLQSLTRTNKRLRTDNKSLRSDLYLLEIEVAQYLKKAEAASSIRTNNDCVKAGRE